MFNSGIKKDITVSGEGLNIWFGAMMKKYPNSATCEHLMTVWMMMSGNTIHDNSLQTFFEKEYTK